MPIPDLCFECLATIAAVARFAGSKLIMFAPGVPLRSIPGFMLSPAPRAKENKTS